MQRLRHSRHLARLVLAWFALTLCVGVVAPSFDPQGLAWLCTTSTVGAGTGSSGDPASAAGDAGGMAAGSFGMHCPLCGTAGAPPPALPRVAQVPERAEAVPLPRPAPAQHLDIATQTLARGPPAAVLS
jgi:hypothetical protein